MTTLAAAAVVAGFLCGLLGGLYTAWVGLRWSNEIGRRAQPSAPSPAAVARDAGVARTPMEQDIAAAAERQLQAWMVGDKED